MNSHDFVQSTETMYIHYRLQLSNVVNSIWTFKFDKFETKKIQTRRKKSEEMVHAE